MLTFVSQNWGCQVRGVRPGLVRPSLPEPPALVLRAHGEQDSVQAGVLVGPDPSEEDGCDRRVRPDVPITKDFFGGRCSVNSACSIVDANACRSSAVGTGWGVLLEANSRFLGFQCDRALKYQLSTYG